MTASRRFYALALGQTFVVAVLAGTLSALFRAPSLHPSVDKTASDLAAALSSDLVGGFALLVALFYVAIPLVSTAYLVRYGDRDPLVYAAFGSLSLVPLLVPLSLWAVFDPDPRPILVVGLAALAFALLGAAFLFGRSREGPTVGTGVPTVQLFNVGLVGVVIAGALFGATVAAPPLESHVVVDGDFGVPRTAFAYEYEPAGDGEGVLTVTHDGGDEIGAANLHILGEGVTEVPGATHGSVGAWRGETSRVEWRDDPVVAPGDAVTVGVESDCRVRIVYMGSETVATVGIADCEEVRAADRSTG